LPKQLEESSSNFTFRASLEVLKKIFVTCFILENLDLQDDEEDGRGNFENIIKLLEGAGSAGFWVRAFLIKSVDYGTPQRRRRLFFVGLNKATQSEGSLDKIEQLLKGLQLSCQPPESCRRVCKVGCKLECRLGSIVDRVWRF